MPWLDYYPASDPNAGFVKYHAWAYPGTATSAAAFRIVKVVPTGDTILPAGILWADGNDNLDNIWDNRNALSYSANPALSIEAAGWVDIVPAGAIPGTSFTMPFTIVGMRFEVWLNSSPMLVVGGSPVGNEVHMTGATTFTTGVAVQNGDWFFVRVWL